MDSPNRVAAFVVFTVVLTGATTAYAKAYDEIYPSVIFPSFGQVLNPEDTPPSVATQFVLHSDLGITEVSPREWFEGPPESALDSIATSLPNLGESDAEWLFDRADNIAGECVELVQIQHPADPDSPSSSFERSCP